MATQKLKFIKTNTVPSTGLTVGAIYFETSTHLLKVATSSTETVVYSGVQNVSYNSANKTLTFKMPDGSTKDVNLDALNTTYTFEGGTNQFTVTPRGGTAQTVSVTPSIQNNVLKTNADTTSGRIPKFTDNAGTIADGYSVITDLTSGASDNNIPTSKAVNTAIDNKIAAADAMIFKGTIGTSGTNATLPTSGYKIGWTYKIVTPGTYAGIKCEVGDMIIALNDGRASGSDVINADWTVVQTNIDGSVTGPGSSTNNHVAIFDGASGKVVKDSGYTIQSNVPQNAKFTDQSVISADYHYAPSSTDATDATATAGSNVSYEGSVVTAVKKDSKGHITGVTTGKIPAAPTLSGLGGINTVEFTSDTLIATASKSGTTVSLGAELNWTTFV